MKYVPVIGLEIHAELKTKTKVFCGCENGFGREENSLCCPVCTGLPGALPMLNRQAVKFAVMAGLALNCQIAELSKWDRKNYFYPDSPKAYQISQLYAPLCLGGGLTVNGRFIRLNHIHLEEDAGKLIHSEGFTRMDFNRAGVPLIEIVTEPDMRSSDEAVEFVEKIRQALVYAGVCDGKMEQGSLRVDANVSIMPEGSTVFGTRAEIKNINSFKFIKSAIEYEIKRQSEILDKNGTVEQETRRYNTQTGETGSMRSKEDAEDYRYFPDPDILPLRITREEVELYRSRLPISPFARHEKYVNEYKMSERDAETLIADKSVSDYFEKAVSLGGEPTAVLNAIKGEIMRCVNRQTEGTIVITAEDLVYLLKLEKDKKITAEGLKIAITKVFDELLSAEEVLKKYNLILHEDNELILTVIAEVLSNNPKAVLQYKGGDEKVFSYLIGQCNRILRGKARIETIQRELKGALEEIK